MSTEKNKALVLRYLHEAWEKGNPEAIDELCAERFTFNVVDDHKPMRGGREELKQRIARTHGYAKNLQMTVHETLAEGDRVALRFTYDALVEDKPLKLAAVMFVHLINGKINEYWYYDQEVTSG